MKKVLVFLVISCAISWMVWLPLYGSRFGFSGLPEFPLHHALGSWGPLLGALLTIVLFDRSSLRSYFQGFRGHFKLKYFLVAFLAPPIIAVIACILVSWQHRTFIDLRCVFVSKEFPKWSVTEIVLYNVLSFGIGEEAGWRGYVLPKLQALFSPFKAMLLTTVIWAVWHIPLFLYRPGYTAMDASAITGWLFSLLVGSILLSWLYNSTNGNIWICGIFHATIDVAFTAAYLSADVVPLIGAIVCIWGLVVFAMHLRKGRLVWRHLKILPE